MKERGLNKPILDLPDQGNQKERFSISFIFNDLAVDNGGTSLSR
jgi:hypothetical protein